MGKKLNKYSSNILFAKIDNVEEFTPMFEVVLLERNGVGEPYKNKDKTKCKVCNVIHPYRMKHYFATSTYSLASQYDFHRRKNPIPKRNNRNEKL